MSSPTNPHLPSPPFHTVPNIDNLRDAALSPGIAHIRPRILFRSAQVSKLSPTDWTALHSLGIRHVFDLRSAPEVSKGWAGVTGLPGAKGGEEDVRAGWEKGMKDAGITRAWVPVFPEADYSPERLAERYMKYMGESTEGFVNAYADILAHAGPAFATILKYLAALPPQEGGKNEEVGALIHCTAGKDRTGIFFGLLFDFLDVPRSAIAGEYNLTELGLAHVRDSIVARLMQSPGFKKYTLRQISGQPLQTSDLAAVLSRSDETRVDGEVDVPIPPEILEKGRQAALRMISAKKESMISALDMVDREWGGAEAYMRSVCGLGDADLDALRRNLLVKK